MSIRQTLPTIIIYHLDMSREYHGFQLSGFMSFISLIFCAACFISVLFSRYSSPLRVMHISGDIFIPGMPSIYIIPFIYPSSLSIFKRALRLFLLTSSSSGSSFLISKRLKNNDDYFYFGFRSSDVLWYGILHGHVPEARD